FSRDLEFRRVLFRSRTAYSPPSISHYPPNRFAHCSRCACHSSQHNLAIAKRLTSDLSHGSFGAHATSSPDGDRLPEGAAPFLRRLLVCCCRRLNCPRVLGTFSSLSLRTIFLFDHPGTFHAVQSERLLCRRAVSCCAGLRSGISRCMYKAG